MKVNMNMCKLDRSLRIILSLTLVYIGLINTAVIGNTVINVLIGSFGLFNLLSAIIGFCPVYFMAKITTLGEPK